MRLFPIKRLGLVLSRKKDETFLFVKEMIATKPQNMGLYRLAFTHKSYQSVVDEQVSNERLEFLGDAILDAIVSDVLYKRYPYKTEGELTQYRSNVVKRASLNKIALHLGFDRMLIAAPNANISDRMFGDMLEAFIGAVYLDKGYRVTLRFVQNKIINSFSVTNDLAKDRNYKSKLLEWGQQYKKEIVFSETKEESEQSMFLSSVSIDGVEIAQGKGKTKKESHNDVARLALKRMSGK